MTVIGHMTRMRGDLECQGDLQIEGELEGSVRQIGGRVTIGADAHVVAHIAAQDVVVMGRVQGDIHATGRVDLRSTAVVTGDIFAGRLSMEENATLHGQVDPSRATEEFVPRAVAPRPEVLRSEAFRPEALREEVAAPYDEAPLPPMNERESEHRQALPLREDSTSRYRVPQAEPVANERQLPSALAAFAPGGRKDLSERPAGTARSRHENSWNQRDRN